MSKKKKNEENDKLHEYVDVNNSISVNDFLEFIKEKEVSNECPACHKPTMAGVMSMEKDHSLVLSATSKDMTRFVANECIGRICLSCGNLQLFWTNLVKSWKKSKSTSDDK